MSDTYKDAGVDINAGYEVVARIKKHIEKTKRLGVMGNIGSFGGFFDLSALAVKEPVLVSGTDSVGSKVKLAIELNQHGTIGIDVVAMCVNDILVQGAEPLFFLDYIGCGKVAPATIETIVKGVTDGCIQANCALVGGETAEIASLYANEDYDLVGCAVGVVEKSKIITGENILADDLVIGLPATGVHSNGFSLMRKIIEQNALKLSQIYPEISTKKTLGEILLTPTKIYFETIKELLKKLPIKGMAHITGGGFIENIPRILPAGLGVEITEGSWETLPIFNFLQEKGRISKMEMYNIFNMGIGMVAVVSAEDVKKQLCSGNSDNFNSTNYPIIGRVVKGKGCYFV
ncbi:MAG: phosphoribosylformylglycinamidine cyclo-ligase [Defluviitaleaceae bacterium]|nr:phosphoribosylformylglycinamidine cyclo-ligase [Defluviitaleaceae bacterium]